MNKKYNTFQNGRVAGWNFIRLFTEDELVQEELVTQLSNLIRWCPAMRWPFSCQNLMTIMLYWKSIQVLVQRLKTGGDMLLRMYTHYGNAKALKWKSWINRLVMKQVLSRWPCPLKDPNAHGLKSKWYYPFGPYLYFGSAKPPHLLHLKWCLSWMIPSKWDSWRWYQNGYLRSGGALTERQ